MEDIEFSHVHLSLARKISVSQKNNIFTDRKFLQISGRKQISAQPVINGTTVHGIVKFSKTKQLHDKKSGQQVVF